MKKGILLLGAAAGMLLYSCGNSNKEGEFTKEQVDSMMKAKEDSILNAQKLAADSAMAAEAQRVADSLRIADSLANAAKGATGSPVAGTAGRKPSTKPSTNNKPEPTAPEAKPEEPRNPKKDRFDGGKTGGQDKSARFNDEAKEAEKQKSTEKKRDRFNSN